MRLTPHHRRLAVFLTIPLLAILALMTILPSGVSTNAQSSTCTSGYKSDKGLNPGNPLTSQNTPAITPQVAQQLAASCAEVIRLDIVTTGFYVMGSNGVAHLDEPSFYSTYFTMLKNLAQAYPQGHAPRVIGLMGNGFLADSHGTAKYILSEARENSIEQGKGNGDNRFIRAFAAQAEGVVRHFQDCGAECGSLHIQDWEVWNEPNNGPKHDGSTDTYINPSNFAALLSRVYVRLKIEGWQKGIDPRHVRIISGGLLGMDAYPSGKVIVPCSDSAHAGADYLENTYKMGLRLRDGRQANGQPDLLNWTSIANNRMNITLHGGYPIDLVGQHIYVHQDTHSKVNKVNCHNKPVKWDSSSNAVKAEVATFLGFMHKVYASHPDRNTGRKTMITELGWPTVPSYDGVQNTGGVSEDTQASYLDAAFQAARQSGYVTATVWFRFQDAPPNDSHGLLRAGGHEKRAWGKFQGE